MCRVDMSVCPDDSLAMEVVRQFMDHDSTKWVRSPFDEDRDEAFGAIQPRGKDSGRFGIHGLETWVKVYKTATPPPANPNVRRIHVFSHQLPLNHAGQQRRKPLDSRGYARRPFFTFTKKPSSISSLNGRSAGLPPADLYMVIFPYACHGEKLGFGELEYALRVHGRKVEFAARELRAMLGTLATISSNSSEPLPNKVLAALVAA